MRGTKSNFGEVGFPQGNLFIDKEITSSFLISFGDLLSAIMTLFYTPLPLVAH
jgi:hypothetical protein